ncbi:hypothetical protein BDFG_06805 [Blastomyces dermatitidis ATCC 26199]|nr:hypothetical protein BDFG_06805 [Blastomyces dermatitidis ATCC 26199]
MSLHFAAFGDEPSNSSNNSSYTEYRQLYIYRQQRGKGVEAAHGCVLSSSDGWGQGAGTEAGWQLATCSLCLFLSCFCSYLPERNKKKG